MNINVFFISIILGGWLASRLFQRLRLPAVLGMALFGVVFGIFFKTARPELMDGIEPSLKSLALIIILLRAGLGISRSSLRRAGITAILMAIVPCLLEGAALTPLFHLVFGFDWFTAGMTGYMLAAVSPAVIVPSMLDLKKGALGSRNDVTTIILAGASADDVIAITFFSVFLGLASGNAPSVTAELLHVPVSVVLGIGAGIIAGFILAWFYRRHHGIRATEKTIILITLAVLLVQAGDMIHIASLLGVMTAGFILLERAPAAAQEMALKLSKIWILAEILLFVLIGYAVDVRIAADAGLRGVGLIGTGLIFRSLGVLIATAFSKLSWKERLFCVIAYTPKATVQAALGGVALAAGLPHGREILAIALLAIIFTAPLGLLGIRYSAKRLLA